MESKDTPTAASDNEVTSARKSRVAINLATKYFVFGILMFAVFVINATNGFPEASNLIISPLVGAIGQILSSC